MPQKVMTDWRDLAERAREIRFDLHRLRTRPTEPAPTSPRRRGRRWVHVVVFAVAIVTVYLMPGPRATSAPGRVYAEANSRPSPVVAPADPPARADLPLLAEVAPVEVVAPVGAVPDAPVAPADAAAEPSDASADPRGKHRTSPARSQD